MEYDLSSGEVYLWQEWYAEKDIKIEAKISSCYQLQQPRDGQLESVIRSFHSHHGHAINGEAKIVTGLGSTQVFLGLIYAFAVCMNRPKYFEQVPYCPLHKNLVSLLGQEWAVSKGQIIEPQIEFVTSPNNPDGSIRSPVTSAPVILWDASYAWPWYGFTLMKLLSKMKKSCVKRLCIPVFSFSKSLGLAGERVGYALIPPSVQKAYPKLLDAYAYYISTSTLGTCRPGEGVCRVIASGYREFPVITERLEQRYDVISEKLKNLLRGIEILSPRGFPYLWVKYTGINLHVKLLSLGIRGSPGIEFGMTEEYARLSLLAPSNIINKISALKQ